MTAFPTGWALQKPVQTIEPAEFERMWRRGVLIPTRKRDGNRAHILTAGDATRIYSRNGTLDWTEKLGHIAAHWSKAPAGLLVDVEVHTMEEGTTSFQDAMNNRPGDIVFSAFDTLRLDGSNVNQPYRDRLNHLDQIERVIGPGDHWGGGVFYNLPENATYAEVLKRVERDRCEGVVVWDASAGHALNTNGNTKRGRSWKIKPRHTEDLVVLGVNAPKDASLGLGCASLRLARQIAKGMPLVPIKAPVGSFDVGFDRHSALRMATPFIVEVSHFGEDDGNLVFPKVLRCRPDLHADFGVDVQITA